LLALIKPSRGRVLWLGEDLNKLDEETLRKKRQDLQIVFQDPLAALDPRMTVRDIIAEPLWTFFPKIARVQVDERVRGVMKMVGLLSNQVNRYPHEFSGGQCQRIGIARALVLNPKLIVCDEPVSALDVSIQAQIINLLKDLQKKLNLSLVFIAHDLSVVKHISDRVMVMYLGRAMEISYGDHLYKRPLHPYTSALIKAAPVPDPKLARAAIDTGLTGDMPSPLDPPPGCVFHTRCPFSVKRCQFEVPALRRMENGDWVACHCAEELDLTIKDFIEDIGMTRISLRTLAVLAVLLLISGCKTTKVISEWDAGRDNIDKRERIAVIAMMPESLQRLVVEQEIVRVMRKSGRNALVSSDVPGLSGRLSREIAEPALKAASVDAIIVVFITSGGKGERLERADYFTQMVGSGFYGGGYGYFTPGFTNVYTVVEGAGFYEQQNFVYAETTYFDLVEDRAKWSMITRSKDLDHNDAAKDVSKKIVSKMKSTGTL